MKPFSESRKPLNRARARNALLLNQLATPGLGSLLCGRWLAGIGQLIFALASCALIFFWFAREMSALYSTAVFSETPASPPNGKILLAGIVLLVISWFWSLATSLSLLREASNQSVEALKNSAEPPPLKLPSEKIALAMSSISGWQKNGDVIFRTFQFKDFPAAMKFVNAVAAIAEHEWHHPDIDIRWNKVTLALTTHDAGGLTEKDFALAKNFDVASLR